MINESELKDGFYWIKPKGFNKSIIEYVKDNELFYATGQTQGVGYDKLKDILICEVSELDKNPDTSKGNLPIQFVSNHRELLQNFLIWYDGDENSNLPKGIEELLDIYLQ